MDCPKNTRGHSLVGGFANGDMFLIGGLNNDDGTSSYDVWMMALSGNAWRLIGTLQQAVYYGSGIKEGNNIYSFAGNGDAFKPIQNLSLKPPSNQDREIEQITVIGTHFTQFYTPILLISDINTCATT